ncbi:hypothetical protein [Massilibacteroides sp.]|uniref:hypothetical protein n=1 Tax=Massilibacteroides sp. TaxID=2034766 RepID=UPI00260D7C34|nr:hypothetical protein [Massilibacteroides sp.]MDD4515316.1 hypothetical protein [Massilibacteroides sp.]
MKERVLYIVIVVSALFSACSHDDADTLFAEYATPQALLSDITISLAEQTQAVDSIYANEEGFYLYIETTEYYPYCNYGILRSTFQTGDTLLVRLEDIVKPSVNLSPSGPAITSVKIPENTKQIVFLRGHNSDRFELQIEDDALLLQPVSTSFTTAEHMIYLRNDETTP